MTMQECDETREKVESADEVEDFETLHHDLSLLTSLPDHFLVPELLESAPITHRLSTDT